jgi:hypothetical protein
MRLMNRPSTNSHLMKKNWQNVGRQKVGRQIAIVPYVHLQLQWAGENKIFQCKKALENVVIVGMFRESGKIFIYRKSLLRLYYAARRCNSRS